MMPKLCRCSMASTISARYGLATLSARYTSFYNSRERSPPCMYSIKKKCADPSEKEKAAFTKCSPPIFLNISC